MSRLIANQKWSLGSPGGWRRFLPATSPRWADAMLVTGSILFGTFLREPLALTRPQLWAEDGAVFFVQSYLNGSSAILQPYAGYFHLYPRLIAQLSAALPLHLIPGAYVAGNVLAQLVVGWMCLSPRLTLNRWLKVAMGAAVSVAPAQNEVFNKLVNSQWILALTLLLVLAYREPTTPGEWLCDAGVALVAGLTGPFSLIFAPLFLLRIVTRRADGYGRTVAAIGLGCAVVQLLNISNPSTAGGFHWTWAYLRVVNGWMGHVFSGSLLRPAPPGVLPTLLLFTVTTVVIVALATRAWVTRNRPMGIFLVGGLAVLSVVLYKFRGQPEFLFSMGSRYFYIPTVTLVWSLLAAWQPGLRARQQPLLAAGLGLALFAFVQDHRSGGSANVALDWDEASRCIGKVHPCVVPINPPGWTLVVP